jgi:hypothetical protein
MSTGSFAGVKRPGRGVGHPLPSSAEVKERVQLYFYSPLGLRGLFYGEIYLVLSSSGTVSSKILRPENIDFMIVRKACKYSPVERRTHVSGNRRGYKGN